MTSYRTVFVPGAVAGIVTVRFGAWLVNVCQAHASHQRRAAQQRQALLAAREQPVLIEDDRITCALCWEARHPGEAWPFRAWHMLCREHSQSEEEQHRREPCRAQYHPTQKKLYSLIAARTKRAED